MYMYIHVQYYTFVHAQLFEGGFGKQEEKKSNPRVWKSLTITKVSKLQ